MFQLIVTLLAIALGAAAAVAAVYYGGSAFSGAGGTVQAARLVAESQQLAGWMRTEEQQARRKSGVGYVSGIAWTDAWARPDSLPRRMGWSRLHGTPAPLNDLMSSALMSPGPVFLLPQIAGCRRSIATSNSTAAGHRGLALIGPPGCQPVTAALMTADIKRGGNAPLPAGDRVVLTTPLDSRMCRDVNRQAIGAASGSATSGGNRQFGCDRAGNFYYVIGE